MGKNSNCPVWRFSCGKYNTIDLLLVFIVAAIADEEYDDVEAVAEPLRGLVPTNEDASNSICEYANCWNNMDGMAGKGRCCRCRCCCCVCGAVVVGGKVFSFCSGDDDIRVMCKNRWWSRILSWLLLLLVVLPIPATVLASCRLCVTTTNAYSSWWRWWYDSTVIDTTNQQDIKRITRIANMLVWWFIFLIIVRRLMSTEKRNLTGKIPFPTREHWMFPLVRASSVAFGCVCWCSSFHVSGTPSIASYLITLATTTNAADSSTRKSIYLLRI